MRGDYDAIAELLHPEVKWHGGDPSAKGACRNREEALAFMRDAWGRRGRRGKLIDVVGAGDKVVVIIQPSPQGAEAAGLSANVTTFQNGQVVEMVHYPDPRDALAAAGLTPSPR
jgi:ketosteroid isomerase-like protein